MDEPESWRWVWVAAAVFFGLGEMATPGAFFMAPFAIGAVVAAILAFADVSVAGEWGAFVVISVVCLFALRPLAHRVNAKGTTQGVGSRRLIGRSGIVLAAIESGELGVVRVDREEWRAQAQDGGAIEAGTTITVTDVEGTRVIVTPSEGAGST